MVFDAQYSMTIQIVYINVCNRCKTLIWNHVGGLYRVRYLTFFVQLVFISWMVTLSSCLIWQIISFILPLNKYGCVYTRTTLGSGPAIDLQKLPILANKSSFQAKLSLLEHSKTVLIHWKVDAKRTSHCLVRILVQRHNWSIFLRKWTGEAVTVNGDHYRAMLNELLFTKIKKEDIGNIWFQQDGTIWHTAEATLDVLRTVFEDHIINRRADFVWPPRNCDLTPLDY